MNNYDIETLLSVNYCKALDSVTAIDKNSLHKRINIHKKHSKTGVRIMRYRISVAIAIIALIISGTIGAVAGIITLREKIMLKADNSGVTFTDKELDEVTSNLSQHPSYYNSDYPLPFMAENENGQKYGSIEYGLELMIVGGVDNNGKEIQGLCYTSDFWNLTLPNFERYADVQDWNDAKCNGEIRNWIYVFGKDGETVIGKYIDYSIVDEDGDSVPIGFVTNEMLSTGKYDNYIYNGDDTEEYDLIVKQRVVLCN